MILLLDVGNTNTHAGLARGGRVVRHADFATSLWRQGKGASWLRAFSGGPAAGAVFCTVVPDIGRKVRAALQSAFGIRAVELNGETAGAMGIGIDYPRPETIGPDRLANAVAVRRRFGAPAVVIDFGTAVTFDVVDRRGNYAGGVIAPGLSAMTDYLHEKTALLPRIGIRETSAAIGKSTEEAMLIGAVHGYRGLILELLKRIRKELRARHLPVIATGGCANLIAAGMKEITAVEPLLTLEGLRLVWEMSPRSDSKNQ